MIENLSQTSACEERSRGTVLIHLPDRERQLYLPHHAHPPNLTHSLSPKTHLTNAPSTNTLTMALQTYPGNCHCAAFRFTISCPPITTANACNCSICTKKQYLFVSIPVERFKVTRGKEEELREYKFSEKRVVHKVCPLTIFIFLDGGGGQCEGGWC